MSKKKSRLTTALTSGKKKTHGGYSYLTTGKLPEHRRYIEQYLTAARMSLIADYGPTEEDLSTAQLIIIDRAISKMGILRCMEEHCREGGVMRGSNVAPCLRSTYLSYGNSLRLDLQALKDLGGKKANDALDPTTYLETYRQDKEGKG